MALLRREGEESSAPVPTVKAKADPAAEELYTACFNDTPDGVFYRTGDTVRLLPPDFPEARGVHVLCAGTAVGEIIRGRTERIEPAHAVFQSAKAENCRRVVDLAYTDARVSAFLRGEEIAVDTENGFTAVAVEGITCGFGKVSNGRLKNWYPKGLRLLG